MAWAEISNFHVQNLRVDVSVHVSGPAMFGHVHRPRVMTLLDMQRLTSDCERGRGVFLTHHDIFTRTSNCSDRRPFLTLTSVPPGFIDEARALRDRTSMLLRRRLPNVRDRFSQPGRNPLAPWILGCRPGVGQAEPDVRRSLPTRAGSLHLCLNTASRRAEQTWRVRRESFAGGSRH